MTVLRVTDEKHEQLEIPFAIAGFHRAAAADSWLGSKVETIQGQSLVGMAGRAGWEIRKGLIMSLKALKFLIQLDSQICPNLQHICSSFKMYILD